MRKLPEPRSGARRLLVALLDSPGTIYQICERAGVDIESDRAERIQRDLLDRLVDGGHACLVGITFYISAAARRELAPDAPYTGQVAGPAYRGTPHPAPVKIVRSAAGAHP